MNREQHPASPKPEIAAFAIQLVVVASLAIAYRVSSADYNNHGFLVWLLACLGTSALGASVSVILLWRLTKVDGPRIAFSVFASLVLWLPAYAAYWPWMAGAWLFGAATSVVGYLIGLVVCLSAVRFAANRVTNA